MPLPCSGKGEDNEAKPADLALAHADCAALLRAVAADAAAQLAVLKAEADAAAAAERSAEEAQAAIARCGEGVLDLFSRGAGGSRGRLLSHACTHNGGRVCMPAVCGWFGTTQILGSLYWQNMVRPTELPDSSFCVQSLSFVASLCMQRGCCGSECGSGGRQRRVGHYCGHRC